MPITIDDIKNNATFSFSLPTNAYFGRSRLIRLMKRHGFTKLSKQPTFFAIKSSGEMAVLIADLEVCLARIAMYSRINECKLYFGGQLVYDYEQSLKVDDQESLAA